MYQEKIEDIRKNRGLVDDQNEEEDDANEKRSANIQKFLNEKKALQEKSLQQQNQHRNETKQMDKLVKDADERVKNLQKVLKEKQQENRISKLKIKELSRHVKHNQLHPLSHSIDPVTSSGLALLTPIPPPQSNQNPINPVITPTPGPNSDLNEVQNEIQNESPDQEIEIPPSVITYPKEGEEDMVIKSKPDAADEENKGSFFISQM